MLKFNYSRTAPWMGSNFHCTTTKNLPSPLISTRIACCVNLIDQLKTKGSLNPPALTKLHQKGLSLVRYYLR